MYECNYSRTWLMPPEAASEKEGSDKVELKKMRTKQPQMHQHNKTASVQAPLWRRPQVGYLASLPLVGLALLGSLLEQRLGLHGSFSSAPLLLAVLLISLAWGTGPALLAILVSTLVLYYVYVPLTGSFDIRVWDGLLQLLPFLLCGAIIVRITAQREAARERALLAEQELDTYADELELDNRLKDEVLSLTAHELDTSLRSIGEQVQVIEHHPSQQRERASHSGVEQKALDQIDEQMRYLQSLDDDLLSVESGPGGETSLQSAPYDLRDICRTLVEAPSLHKGRTIELEVPSLPTMVQIDREYLRQVLVTVVRHAFKHASPDGAVQVCVGQEKEQIIIQVRDVEPDHAQDQEQYPPGSRPIETYPVASDDSGLWLVISKTIVEWYDGRLWYTTSPHGRGSTCTIELPALQV